MLIWRIEERRGSSKPPELQIPTGSRGAGYGSTGNVRTNRLDFHGAPVFFSLKGCSLCEDFPVSTVWMHARTYCIHEIGFLVAVRLPYLHIFRQIHRLDALMGFSVPIAKMNAVKPLSSREPSCLCLGKERWLPNSEEFFLSILVPGIPWMPCLLDPHNVWLLQLLYSTTGYNLQ